MSEGIGSTQLSEKKTKTMQQQTEHQAARQAGQQTNKPTPIAIIGMGFRFPGHVHDEKSMWSMLTSGTSAITEIPESRWPVSELQHPDRSEPGRSVTFAAGVLDNVLGFDAGFFGISPREAAWLDPQQRLLLEMAHEAMEEANLPASSLAGTSCGVYVGISSLDYGQHALDDLASMTPHVMTGNTLSIAANRISYTFDLHGPSLALDTACSSSLVALHHACEALREGSIPLALAGGISLLMHPYSFVGFSKASMISAHGHCLPFDARADGYVRAEGGGLFLLKPLDAALRDGNPIQAVILASGINTDGARKKGLTIPSEAAQAELMGDVLRQSGLAADDLAFIEAHGTGTPVGDPVEVASIGKAIGAFRSSPLPITSVKAHVGHLEPASGMAGIVKAIVCLKNREVPGLPFAFEPNPAIDFKKANVVCAAQDVKLKEGTPLCCGVNSFGFGGANAHILLQFAPAKDISEQVDITAPIFLSAKTNEALRELAGRYADAMEADVASAYDLAYGARYFRDQYEKCLAIDGKDKGACVDALRCFSKGIEKSTDLILEERASDRTADNQGLVFVYTGNGAQWVGMGQRLLAESKVFAKSLDTVDALLSPLLGKSVKDLLLNVTSEELQETAYSQPLLFAIQVGVTEVLASLGVTPAAVVGHSVGDIAAAWACGALSLQDAVRVIHARSATQSTTRGLGRMAAFARSAEQSREIIEALHLEDEVEIAGINSPHNVTLTGSLEGLEKIHTHAAGAFFQLLDLDYAFHSRHMDGIREELFAALKDIAPQKGSARFFSTVTGKECEGENLDAAYWWNNVRQSVQFFPAVHKLCEEGYCFFVEIGPHAILQRYLRECLQNAGVKGRIFSSLVKTEDGIKRLQTLSLRLHCLSSATSRESFFPRRGNPFVQLPLYPWQNREYTYPRTSECIFETRRVHPLLGWQRESTPPLWENILDPAKDMWLEDHKVGSVTVLAGAAFTEMALAAVRNMYGTDHVLLEDMQIIAPLAFEGAQCVRLSVDDTCGNFRIISRPRLGEGAWVEHVRGRILQGAAKEVPAYAFSANPDSWKRVSGNELYAITTGLGLDYGPSFRLVQDLRCDAVSGRLEANISPVSLGSDGYLLLPQALDACFHALAALYAKEESTDEAAYLPVGLDRLEVLAGEGDANREITRLAARIVYKSRRSLAADFALCDRDGNVLVRATACRFRAAPSLRSAEQEPVFWTVEPVLCPLPDTEDSGFVPDPEALKADIEASVWNKQDPKRTLWYKNTLPLLDAMTMSLALEAFDKIVRKVGKDGFASVLKNPCARYWARVLQQEGFMKITEQGPSFDASLPESENIMREALSADPQALPYFVRAGRAGLRLADIFLGKQEGMDVYAELMRPSSACAMLRDLDNLLNSGMNRALAHIVRKLAEKLPAGRQLRVLEVCEAESGTSEKGQARASTLAQICRALCSSGQIKRDRIDLVAAIQEGEGASGKKSTHRFEDGFSCEIVSLGQDEWNIADNRGGFDLVYVEHCLFKVPNRSLALTDLQGTLRPGGLLVLAERSPDLYAELVEGLVPSFWRKAATTEDGDEQVVPGLMPVMFWQKLLEKQGFASPVVLREPAAEDLEEGAYLVLGRKSPESCIAEEKERAACSQTFLLLGDTTDDCPEKSGNEDNILAALSKTLSAQGHNVLCLAFSSDKEALSNACAKAEHVVLLASRTVPEKAAHLLQTVLNTASTCNGACDDVRRPEMWIVTRNGNLLPHEAENVRVVDADPAACTLSGLARVMRNEYAAYAGGLVVHQLDLCQSLETSIEEQARLIAKEFLHSDGADEIVLAGSGRFAPALVPFSMEREAQNMALEFARPGRLENLVWRPVADISEIPEHGLEIEVMATGLNFRDIMLTMGLLPDDAVENGFARANLGLEFSGRVMRVGAGVADFVLGDRVAGFGKSCFASKVLTGDYCVARIPDTVSFESAATLPVVFFTAWYALKHLANIQPGERLLIHGAAGGLGMAAIQIARHLGAELFATAGSDEKRDFLALSGVTHVYNSRDCSFVNEILADTKGEGIDVVINSLAGEAMRQSVALLRPFGRFLELGKRDFVENTSLGLKPFKENISYFAIDADQMLAAKPQLARTVFAEVMDLLAKGVLSPLPCRTFDHTEVKEAFRTMQKAQHMGKIVVRSAALSREQTGWIEDRQKEEQSAQEELTQRGTWLVSGGQGGFGLALARHLAERGVSSLVLASRRGMATPGADDLAQEFADKGVRLEITTCDMADKAAVRELLARLGSGNLDLPPLEGIIHTAAVFDDKALSNMDEASFERVLAPKFLGAWNLHEATRDIASLKHFVLFSSISTMLGNPGQGNYVAANAGLEGLTRLRREENLPCTCLAWGPIDDVGYLTRHEDVKQSLGRRLGAVPLSIAVVLKAFDKALGHQGYLLIANVDWDVALSGFPTIPGRLAALKTSSQTKPQADSTDFLEQIKGLSPEEVTALVLELAREEVALVLNMEVGQIPLDRSLQSLGLDSLMAVELAAGLEQRTGVNLPVMLFSDSPTLEIVSQRITARLTGTKSLEETNAGVNNNNIQEENTINLKKYKRETLILQELSRTALS